MMTRYLSSITTTVTAVLLSSMFMVVVVVADLKYPVYFNPNSSNKNQCPNNGNCNPLNDRSDVNGNPEGPKDWDNVDRDAYVLDYYQIVGDSEYKENQCEDRSIYQCQDNIESNDCYNNKKYWDDKTHKQSPVIVQYDKRIAKCDDRHEFHTPTDGICDRGDGNFYVLPNGLYAKFDCEKQPILDMSRNPNKWNFEHIEIKTPSEHSLKLDNGKVLNFPAELHLVHTGTSGNKDDLGIIAVWLDDSTNKHNQELEKYIIEWEIALKQSYKDCNYKTFDLDSCDDTDDTGGGGDDNDDDESKCSNEKKVKCCHNTNSRRELTSTSTSDSNNNYVTIFHETFENWNNNENYTGKYFRKSFGKLKTFKYGSYRVLQRVSIRLQSSSGLLSHNFNSTTYNNIKIFFYMSTTGVEDNEKLILEFYDGTDHYKHIQDFKATNNQGDYYEITIDNNKYNFDTQSHIRFRTTGSGDSDKWYLDNITIKGHIKDNGSNDDDSGENNTCTTDEIKECCGDDDNNNRRLLSTSSAGTATITNENLDDINSLLRGGSSSSSTSTTTTNTLMTNNQEEHDNESTITTTNTLPLSQLLVSSSNYNKTRTTATINDRTNNNYLRTLSSSQSSLRHPNRQLEYNCNKNDYFCPYDLYIQTDNPYYHRYYGSLTQPPCTENVRWRVMIDPLQISKEQLNRIEMLIAKYIDQKTCQLGTWGKSRSNSKCKVDVNRPLQYLTRKHKVEDCEKYYDGKDWSFESAGIDLPLPDNMTPVPTHNVTNTTTTAAATEEEKPKDN